MANIIGFSAVKQLGQGTISFGETGNTGPTGPTGPYGLGLTGNTGSSISGITLIDRYLVTSFSDGTSYSTPNKIYGNTGTYTYIVDYLNSGSGISIGYGISGTDELLLRPIRVVNNTSNNLLITTSSEDVTVNLSTIGGAGITLVSNSLFTDDYLLKFKSGKLKRVAATRGVTSGSSSYYGLDFNSSNLFELVRGMGWTGSTAAVNCIISSSGVTCDINPLISEYDDLMYGSTSKIFVGDFSGQTGNINITACPNDGKAYGFEMYIYNAKNPKILNSKFTSASPIKWPLNKQPCFSVDGVTCDLRISFFGLQGTWYATAKHIGQKTDCGGSLLFSTNCTTAGGGGGGGAALLPIFGACCKWDGSCLMTDAVNCDGYFHGIGTTCGNTYSSICDVPGACCVSPRKGIKECFELTSVECIGISFSSFAGNGSFCDGADCIALENKIGACCNGLGNCSTTTIEECASQNGYFQGVGSSCLDLYTGLSICSGGTGACCINGVCSTASGTDCLSNNGYYLGAGRSCDEFECPKQVSCLGYVDGFPVQSGQPYGGGIIVGRFEPGKTKILGANKLFDPTSISKIDGTTLYNCSLYTSFLDHTAYGITKDCGFNNESYIIIVYPEDININGKDKFVWGTTGSSWGPISDAGGNYSDFSLFGNPLDTNSVAIQYYNTHLKYNEGYWSTGLTGSMTVGQDLLLKTFPTCSLATIYGNEGVNRVFAKSPYSMHGNWHHSWGLYNTIRAISANNTRIKNINLSGIFKSTDFEYTTGYNAFKASRFISDGLTSAVQGITQNTSSLSDWYLPSHDELAFLASSTANLYGFNINTHLMLVADGEALNGVYWSSTGTFDYNKNEGVYTDNTKPKPGSVAIAFNMDINGNNYKVYKANRMNEYKVRPIRMLRCDAETPTNKYLWRIPSVYQTKTNQRNIDTTLT